MLHSDQSLSDSTNNKILEPPRQFVPVCPNSSVRAAQPFHQEERGFQTPVCLFIKAERVCACLCACLLLLTLRPVCSFGRVCVCVCGVEAGVVTARHLNPAAATSGSHLQETLRPGNVPAPRPHALPTVRSPSAGSQSQTAFLLLFGLINPLQGLGAGGLNERKTKAFSTPASAFTRPPTPSEILQNLRDLHRKCAGQPHRR